MTSSTLPELTSPEHMDKVIGSVIRATRSRNSLPKSLFETLQKFLKPIPGFKDPLKAPPPILKRNLLETVEHIPEYSILLTKIWSETEINLRDVVQKHYEGLTPPDKSEDVASDFWFADDQADEIAAQHAEFDAEDLRLMSRYIAIELIGNTPESDGDEERDLSISDIEVNAFLEGLRARPASDDVWENDIPSLHTQLHALWEDKDNERSQTSELRRAIQDMMEQYASVLVFFSEDSGEWRAQMPAVADAADAEEQIASLCNLLEVYVPLREIGASIAEERARRSERERIEDEIAPIISRLNELLKPPPEVESPHAAVEPEPLDAAELTDLRAELNRVNMDRMKLDEQLQKLLAGSQDLRNELTGLRSDISSLERERDTLASNLHISEANVLYWRNLRESEDPALPNSVPLEFRDVEHAIKFAAERYRGRLKFAFNSVSDTKFRYATPKDIWDGLEWLATEYYDSRSGNKTIPDFDQSIREFCGLWYKGGQSQTTRTMFRQGYTTRVDGIEYKLYEHIGKGSGSNEQHIFRVAFDWDKERQRVIVGYIGKHQPSRKF